MNTEDIDEIFSSRPPRVLSPEIVRSAMPSRVGRAFLFIFGSVFILFSIPFLWIFFPWRIRDSLRLDLGTPLVAAGTVSAVEDTSMEVNGRDVYQVGFEFRLEEGEVLRSQCWTTDAFTSGDSVNVEYVDDDPGIARIEGTSLDPFGYFGSFVSIFSAIGLVVLMIAIRSGRTTARLLTEGEPIVGEITDVTAHGGDQRQGLNYEVHLRYSPDGVDYDKKLWVGAPKGALVMDLYENEGPVSVLYDPEKPKRSIVLELL